MKKVIDFLIRLRVNNRRDWFEENKNEYKEALAEFNAFAEELIGHISGFDPSVKGLTLKDTTYRIYRDTRFSPNKDPYKTHMGTYICRGGKKSGFAGYYFHVEPSGEEGNILTSGIYMPEPAVLKSVRDEIYDNGEKVADAIRKAKGFSLDKTNQLKRLPAGYETGPWDEYIRLKDLYVAKTVENDWLLQDNLPKIAAAEFKKTYPLVELLNRAVEYAHEEM